MVDYEGNRNENNSVLTLRVSQTFERLTNLAGFFGVFPAKWDKRTKRPVGITTKLEHFKYIVMVSGMTLLFAHTAYRTIVVCTGDEALLKKVMTGIIGIGMWGISLLHFKMIAIRSVWRAHMWRTLNFYFFLGENYEASAITWKKVRMAENLHFWTPVAFIANFFLYSIQGILFPHLSPLSIKPTILGMLQYMEIEAGDVTQTAVTLASAVIVTIFALHIALITCHFVLTLVNSITLIDLTLDTMRKEVLKNASMWIRDKLAFNSLRLIFGVLEEMYERVTYFGQVGVIGGAVFSSFCIIRIGGITGVIAAGVSINLMIIMLKVFQSLADIHSNSATLLRQWKQEARTQQLHI